MLNLFRRSFAKAAEDTAPRVFSVGEGRRVYAIGDVHGHLKLLRDLIDAIAADNEQRGAAEDIRLVLLGDLIDRGPESPGVIEAAIAMRDLWPGFACLKGNHEEVFLMALDGDVEAMGFFRRFGRDTLLSYGVAPEIVGGYDDAELQAATVAAVPRAHHDFLASLPSSLVIGDYLFVHAGIRPGVSLEEQDARDLHWIRADFLRSRVEHPYMVVHGHSITEFVDERPNRIGIDTGAYASGRLTAIGLEGTERWYLST
ncbi:MAG: metallophosphoesterase family protein [Sphingobium sp.]